MDVSLAKKGAPVTEEKKETLRAGIAECLQNPFGWPLVTPVDDMCIMPQVENGGKSVRAPIISRTPRDDFLGCNVREREKESLVGFLGASRITANWFYHTICTAYLHASLGWTMIDFRKIKFEVIPFSNVTLSPIAPILVPCQLLRSNYGIGNMWLRHAGNAFPPGILQFFKIGKKHVVYSLKKQITVNLRHG